MGGGCLAVTGVGARLGVCVCVCVCVCTHTQACSPHFPSLSRSFARSLSIALSSLSLSRSPDRSLAPPPARPLSMGGTELCRDTQAMGEKGYQAIINPFYFVLPPDVDL